MNTLEVDTIVTARIGKVCLYCLGDSTGATSEDHPLLEALGNLITLPRGYVCDGCNAYFGHKLDERFVSYYPIAERIVFGCIHGKRGRIRRKLTPQFDLDVSPERIHFTATKPVRLSKSKDENALLITGASPPADMRVISRALYRIALGGLAASNPVKAFHPSLDDVVNTFATRHSATWPDHSLKRAYYRTV